MICQRALWAVLLLFLCVPRFALGQSGRGSLTGTVTDTSGAVLQGARILLDPSGASATTNAQGQYTLTGLSAGKYQVTVSYLGFNTYQESETVESGETERLDAKLTIASTGQTVAVYATREQGEAEAINRTFNADNVINVLPFDVITSLPNANVADAIGRLASVSVERDEGEAKYVQVRGTEPRLTHTTLDGVQIASPETVRQIKLDLIPANLVESVQINKTLEADQEGDGIGGQVDLRTKSAESLRPTVYLEGQGGYTPIIGGRTQYLLDGSVGQRFLGQGKLGVLVGGSYDYNGRGINDVEPGPALSGTYDLRDYQYYRDRYGLSGTVDYRFSDTSNIYAKGLYSHFNNFGNDWIYSPTINSFTSLTQGGTDGSISFQALLRRPVQEVGGIQLGGHHVIRQAIFSWNVNASTASTRDTGYGDATFAPQAKTNPLNNISYVIDVSNPLVPHINALNGVNIFDPTKYFYQGQQLQYFYNPEVDLGTGENLAIPYSLKGHSGTFELGFLFRNEHKFYNQNIRTTQVNAANAEDPTLAMTNFLGGFTDPNYYQGSYGAYPATVDYDKVKAFSAQSASNVIGNAFNQVEKVTAGYIMNSINFGKFRLIAGLRIEATGESAKGFTSDRNTDPGGSPVTLNSSYVSLLPSASLRYSLTPSSGIRIVYGRGLSRPNFSDLVPYTTPPTAKNNSSSRGNVNLQTEYADDIDLLYDRQLPSVGLLQAGFFYKNLQNPIVSVTIPQAANTYPGFPGAFNINQSINAGSAYVYGFEVSFQQHFTYLPGLLTGFGLSTNYGYTKSQATLPAYIANPAVGVLSGPNRGPGGSTPPLLRQAPNTFNLSPTYDKRGFSVRLGLEYNQANIYAYHYNNSNAGPIVAGGGGGGLYGPNGDQYFYSHLQLDLQGSYKLPKGFSIVGYALNLNNEVFGFYQGSTIYPTQREFYHQSFGGGLRWSPHQAQ